MIAIPRTRSPSRVDVVAAAAAAFLLCLTAVPNTPVWASSVGDASAFRNDPIQPTLPTERFLVMEPRLEKTKKVQ